MYFKRTNWVAGSVILLSVAASGNAVADRLVIENTKKHALLIRHEKEQTVLVDREKGKEATGGDCDHKGWKLASSGGLSYLHPDSSEFWFKLSGTLRLDETLFMGSARAKQNDFPSGVSLRTADIVLDGGVGEDWEYSFSLGFKGSSVVFNDIYLAYTGFLPNNQVFVGRISGNWFGLDNSNSTSWSAFLEKSMIANTFYPGDGIGVMTDFWWDMWAITLTALQPQRASSDTSGVRDRWVGIVRATVAPLHEPGDVWHFGVSGAYREVNSATGTRFTVQPPARARNTASLLDTQVIPSNHSQLFNVEFARQYGSFLFESEYTSAFVQGTPVSDGWNLQTRYLLTGEAHEYEVREGAFGSVTPKASYGAVEVAARYDFLNLNNKAGSAGSQHNVTAGINWFLNQQVRLSANYIRTTIHPSTNAQKRNLDIIGMRCQIRFK